MSEHSVYNSEENGDDDDAFALAYTVQKLYQQFQMGYNGCSPEKHQEQLYRHMNAVGNDHHGLDDIFNDPNFPSVLVLPDMISADRLARQAASTPA
jgi:hypothetical protein